MASDSTPKVNGTHSLATQMSVRVITITIALLLLMSFMQYAIARRTVTRQATESAQRDMQRIGKLIGETRRYIERSIITREWPLRHFASSEKLDPNIVIRRILVENPTIVGCGLAYDPTYLSDDTTFVMPYCYRVLGDTTIHAMRVKEYDYTVNDWYKQAVELKQDYWSEPYNDNGEVHRIVTTYSKPLYEKDGTLIGVAYADVSLNWLADEIDSLVAARPCVLKLLIDREGDYLVHPKSRSMAMGNIMKDNSWTEDTATLHRIARDMMAHNSGHSNLRINNQDYSMFYSSIDISGWSVAIAYPNREIYARVDTLTWLVFFTTLLCVGLLLYVCLRTIRRILKPIQQFADVTRDIAGGNFDVAIPLSEENNELGTLSRSFDHMQHALSHHIEQLKEVTAQQERIESELRIAADLQTAMLPRQSNVLNQCPDVDVYAILAPAREVGGDLYNYAINGSSLSFIIADVSGKSVPAALIMAIVSRVFRSTAPHVTTPLAMAQALNKMACENNDACIFVTALIGTLDLHTGELHYCNCGHNSPLLLHNQQVVMLPCESNVALGIIDDFDFVEQETTMESGDTLFLYTDGLNEAMNSQQELFGDDRMMATLQHDGATTSQQHIEAMKQSVTRFVDGAEQSDDLTMMALRYTPTTRHHYLSLVNNMESITQLEPYVSEVIASEHLPASFNMPMRLALDEVVTNVISYGFDPGTMAVIELDTVVRGNKVVITIADQGHPFDPTQNETPDVEAALDDRPIGGLGIFLVKQVMDEVSYERIDDRNVLTLSKTVDPQS
ncbi:MAG: SpoIIE family protein phosphatase [Muribaculaceae bacterium]|nr:SpoIIE family protein phosphatase [Muribaculaceae bacterium]